MHSKWLGLLIILLANVVEADNPEEVMRTLSVAIGKKLLECNNWVTLEHSVLQHFLNYWNPSQKLTDRQMGCAVICIANKLQILNNEGKLVFTNAKGFIMASGADDDMIKEIMKLFTTCGAMVQHQRITDYCLVALEFAKCFRAGIQELHWVPDVTDLQLSHARKFNSYKIIEADLGKCEHNNTETANVVNVVKSRVTPRNRTIETRRSRIVDRATVKVGNIIYMPMIGKLTSSNKTSNVTSGFQGNKKTFVNISSNTNL